jgi:hypothetical protein
MKLTIINQNTDFWDAVSDTAEPVLLNRFGYTLFQQIADPTEFIRVVHANGLPQKTTISGYTNEGERYANKGFSNSGNELLNEDDEVLNDLFAEYAALNGLAYPNRITHDFLKGIDTAGIPEEYFRIENDTDYIKNMASNSLPIVVLHLGIVVTHLGEIVTHI